MIKLGLLLKTQLGNDSLQLFWLIKTLTTCIYHAWKEALKTALEVSLEYSVQCFEGDATHLDNMFRKGDHLCLYLVNLHMDGCEYTHTIYTLNWILTKTQRGSHDGHSGRCIMKPFYYFCNQCNIWGFKKNICSHWIPRRDHECIYVCIHTHGYVYLQT